MSARVVTSLAAALVLGGLVLFWAPWEDGTSATDCEFDRTAWLSSEEQERSDQADELMRCHILVGLPRADVIDLLGQPVTQKPNQARWVVGEDFIDPVFLVVAFDKKGQVATTDIRMLG